MLRAFRGAAEWRGIMLWLLRRGHDVRRASDGRRAILYCHWTLGTDWCWEWPVTTEKN